MAERMLGSSSIAWGIGLFANAKNGSCRTRNRVLREKVYAVFSRWKTFGNLDRRYLVVQRSKFRVPDDDGIAELRGNGL